ncbi:ABC transporter ATP-binding protein [Ruania albidiflava]|uniref:ABC transporter ATP-binding protein n=1 Tax=Ruania albidiflava TaxID=366586 RepID=UPI0003B5846B|nr:ATP-binding cassette domain-containing protein [Ruania albidiflava]
MTAVREQTRAGGERGTSRAPAGGVQVEGLRVLRQGTPVLQDVTFTAPPGAVTALVGPNGSGKSTAVAVIAGDLAPAAGRVTVSGQPVSRLGAARAAQLRSVLPQEVTVAFDYLGAEIVALGRRPWRGQERATERAQVVASALAATDSSAAADRRVLTLSGGERARVQLARVLAQDAAVVLLDEPTAALDLRHQARTLTLCRQIAAAGGTVVVVLHDLDAALSTADHAVLLDRGRVVVAGPVEQVTAKDLERVYRHPISIVSHPVDGRPMVLPARVHAASQPSSTCTGRWASNPSID